MPLGSLFDPYFIQKGGPYHIQNFIEKCGNIEDKGCRIGKKENALLLVKSAWLTGQNAWQSVLYLSVRKSPTLPEGNIVILP